MTGEPEQRDPNGAVIARLPYDDEHVAYYKYMLNGKPVFGPKKSAAQCGQLLETVLRQLRQMMPNEEFEAIGQSVRFKRKGKKEEADKRFGQPHYGHEDTP